MLLRDAGDGFFLQAAVENAARVYDDDRTLIADTVAPREDNVDLVLELMPSDFREELVVDLQGAGCNAPGSAADKDC